MDTAPKQKRPVNPRSKASIFSILTFGFTIETFKLGYTRDIEDSDLYAPLPEHRSDILGDAIQKAWDYEVKHRRRGKPSLWKVLFKVFGLEALLYGLILAIMEFIIRLQQPLFLGLVLRYFSPVLNIHNNGTTTSTYLNRLFSYYDMEGGVTWNEAIFFAFGIIFCSAANVAVSHPFMMGTMHIGMKMRVGVCSLIYRKALRVSLQAMSESSAGLVVNLMANDVIRFDTGPVFAHYIWIGPLETVFMTIYLYRIMGIAAALGALIILAVVPFQVFLGTLTSRFRKGTARKSDERVRLMKEIIMGIEVIKMYTWEEPFRKIIMNSRKNEIHYIRLTSYIRGVIMSFIMFTSRFGIFITVFFYVTFVGHVGVETVFFLTAYYNIMKQTMTLYFPQAIGQFAEMYVAVQRIRDYLLFDECILPHRELLSQRKPPEETAKKQVTIIPDPVEPPPNESNANVEQNSSSDMKSPDIVKELDQDDLSIKFDKAYSRWIKSTTKDDVEDISMRIPTASLTTIIGAVGSGKSTILHMILGELPCSSGTIETKGMVSYASQEPWLFVGTVRQNILFGQTFVKSRYMEVCKACALERDFTLFPFGDRTVVGERGVSLSGGQRARINLARAVYKEADIYLLDDPLSAVDAHVAKHIFEKCIKRYLGKKTVILVTHQLQFIKNVDHIIIMEKGNILAQGSFETLDENGLAIVQFMKNKSVDVVEEETPVVASANKMQSVASVHQAHWSMMLRSGVIDQTLEAEAVTSGRVSCAVFRNYYLAGARCPFVILVFFMYFLAQFCASGCDFWIGLWSRVEDKLTGDSTVDNVIWSSQLLKNRQGFVLVFGCLTLATIFVALTRAFLFFTLCMKSSVNLHDKMFECISHSPMSFFHANPSGRIINRFSKDMGAVDELLPQSMIDSFQILLTLFGTTIVILVTDITLLVPAAAALLMFYLFRLIYVRTAGAVKRLEGITRSPVFGHINATVLGLATIRAYGAEKLLAKEFDHHQDLHSSAWFIFIACSRAFEYFLDIVCLLFIICVTFGTVMKSDVDSSSVGLAITQALSLTGLFQWGMRQSAEVENLMTSVERVLEYTKLTQEPALRCPANKKPPPNWPPEGAIDFKNLTLRYSPGANLVLRKLSFSIKAREKIGIVGRTGAGKSSIIQALFRLAYLEGAIIIDGIDTSSIGLHDLREKLSIIPQEPVLFSGTMRKNLDPFDEYRDEVLLRALHSIELQSDENEGDILNKEVAECGVNFSVGERQLVCLARAIIRNNRVLVLDEATANVDAQTDAFIQTAIRHHFKECTVITIAHRLNTVIDSDKILVLDAGRLLEYDHPHVLLQNKGSFYSMVSETGPAMAQILQKLAADVCVYRNDYFYTTWTIDLWTLDHGHKHEHMNAGPYINTGDGDTLPTLSLRWIVLELQKI